MADSAPPRAKKAKRSAPISRVSAEERAKPFKDDICTDGGVLFCKYCAHSVDYTRVDTIKDHLKSKKHCAKKCSQQSKETASGAVAGPSTSRQVTLSSIVKSCEKSLCWTTLSFARSPTFPCIRQMQCAHSCRNIVSKLVLCLRYQHFATSMCHVSTRSTT